jgi:transketolase
MGCSVIVESNMDHFSAVESLKKSNLAAKKLLLKLHFEAKSGHVGSALSCVEILTFIRFYCWRPGDVVLLSKGHAATALYSVLATAGDIDRSELVSQYYQDGSVFAVHPPPAGIPNIPFATGSLGHGPGICAGLALGSKLCSAPDSPNDRVFCVLSDGELNEGSVWESFAFASHHGLKNLVFFIDRNGFQGFGRTDDVLNMEPIADKLSAFGVSVSRAAGHDFGSLIRAYSEILEGDCGPSAIIAETIKGRGLPEIEGTVDSHYLPLTQEMYQGVLAFCEREMNQPDSKKGC